MFNSTTSIIPIQNPELSSQSESSGYNWKTLTKAGLVFVTTTGAFLTLKATGSFSLINSWWKNSSSKTDLDESSALANINPSTQTYSVPVSEKQLPIAHQYIKREPSSNEAVIKISPEFQVNTYTASYQSGSSVAQLNDGKFVVIWQSNGQDGSDYGVYGQMFNANGIKYASEFRVNSHTTNYQGISCITGLTDGKFVVTWMSTGQDGDWGGIYAQMFNANGTKSASEFQVNTYTTGYQQQPSLASLNDGKFVAVWRSDIQDAGTCGIYGQLFNTDSSRYGSEFQVNTYTADHQTFPAVARLSDGKFVVTWISHGQDGDLQGIYGQMFNADGVKYLSEFQVNTYTTSDQELPSVTGLSDSKFVVAWKSNGQDGDSYGIYGQMFNANATKYASEFLVNTYTIGHQGGPSITALSDDKFTIMWHSYDQDGSTWGVYGQVFNADSNKYASEFQVNTYTTSSQTNPAVAGLTDRKFVVTWTSNEQDGDLEGIYGQMFKVDIAPVLENNNLVIGKGETITLTTNDLSATDEDDDDSTLTFTVSNVQHGQFELKSNPGTLITSFTQQQIIDRNIQFVHDDSNVAPTYKVSVDDGSLNTIPTHPSVTFSAYAPFQEEFRVNTYTTDAQRDFHVSSLNDEKFMVVWESKDGPGFHDIGVYGQLFDGNANKIGDEFQIDTYTISRQEDPSIARLNDGKLIVVWKSTGTSGQFYDANGNPVLSELTLSDWMNGPDVAALENGNFVVVYMAADGWLNGISGQLFNPDGDKIGNEFQVNTYTTNEQVTPSITALRDDEFVIMWESTDQDGDRDGIYGQLLRANGTKIGDEFRVNTHTIDRQYRASGTKISNDKFLATWYSENQDVSGSSIYGQYFYVNGTKIGGEFPVSSYSTLSSQLTCKGTQLSDGMFVLVFDSYFESFSGRQTVAQFFDEDGTKIGDEFMVNTPINGTTQYIPSVATLSDDKFVVVWETYVRDGDSYDGWGQLFKKDIAPILANNTLTIDENQTAVLTNYELSALDVDNDNLNLIFSTSNIQHGQFEIVSNGTMATEFTQQQVIDGDIRFIHDGGEEAPYYELSVSDGILSTPPISASITFTNVNDAPVLLNNNLSINQGETVDLSSSNLNATDVDNDDEALIFIMSDIQHCQFKLVNNGTAVTDFTQQQIIDNNIRFVHDGGKDAPSYNVTVSDGSLSTSPVPAAITFSLSESLASSSGESKVISSSSLSQSILNETSASTIKSSTSKSTISSSVSSVAPETSSTSESTILDSFSSIKSEASSRISTPLSSSEFSSGSESKSPLSSHSAIESTSTLSESSKSGIPSSTSSASQSTTQSKTSEFASTSTKEVSSTQDLFSSSNPATTINKSLLSIILGSIGGITSTSLGIFGAWLKYKKYKATSKMRRQNPLAAGIHKHLHLNISSFESEEGKKYLDVVKGIMGDLEKQGVATDEMDQEALRTLTLSSVKVIKDKIEPKKNWIGRKQIPIEDLEDKKDSITKKIVRKYAKEGKEIKLQIMDDKKEPSSLAKRSAEIDSSKLSKFKKIGQGAMGVVYKAKYHGSDVAVKQLPIIAADSEELGQFEQEAKLMKKLRHPHLVNFYGCYQDETHYSIVMEYVAGGSLDEILYDTQQPFTWYPTRWDVAHDIASAVSFLHSNQIIHRDLKSQNVLVYYEKDRTRAKIADVGIAKIIKQETISTMTKNAGTPLWMAPEVIEAQGEKKKITYDEKVDVYSYGIILSELINRNLPYSEVKNAFQIIPQVLEGKRPDFNEASAPISFIALMQRCWAQRAEERPKMQDVVETLDEIQQEVHSFV